VETVDVGAHEGFSRELDDDAAEEGLQFGQGGLPMST
jgi:hypothetical protein